MLSGVIPIPIQQIDAKVEPKVSESLDFALTRSRNRAFALKYLTFGFSFGL
jgi:hypothetical protein